MRQVVKDAERLMALLNQAVPQFPQKTAAADIYFGGAAAGGSGLLAFNHSQLAQAWKAKRDADVLEHGIRAIASIVCGLRCLGFPVEEAWAAYVEYLVEGGSVEARALFRSVLNKHGFLALAATTRKPVDG